MRDPQDVLVSDPGLDLTGWTLTRAFDLSADGLTLVGDGTNPSGNREAWVATIPRYAPGARKNQQRGPGVVPRPLCSVLAVTEVGSVTYFFLRQIAACRIVWIHIKRFRGGGRLGGIEEIQRTLAEFYCVQNPYLHYRKGAGGDGVVYVFIRLRHR